MTTAFVALREEDILPALSGASPIEVEGLDPQVLQLALAAGLLRPKAGSPGIYELEPNWFTDPVGKTGDALKKHGAEVAELLAQLLGNVGGKALGIPIKNPGDLGTWYPIQNPQTGLPTGLYFTSNTIGDETVFGIGTTHIWPLGGDLEVRAWGMVPLLSVANGNLSIVAGQEKYPLNCGVEFSGKTAIIDRYGFSFKGVKLSASLALLPQPKPDISIVVMQLKLPTEVKASDRSLADLIQLTGEDILTTVASLFVSALSEAAGAAEDSPIAYLLPVLGLTPELPAKLQPQFPGVRLPLLRWDKLAEAVVTGGSPTVPFKDWFNALLSDTTVLEAWLASVQGVLDFPTPLVTGSGTREDPYAIVIRDEPSLGALLFTIASTVDDKGVRTFYPGLRFNGAKIGLGTMPAAVQIAANLELAQFRLANGVLSGDPTSLVLDSGICLVGKGTTDGKDDPLFSGTVAGEKYVFGSLCAGVKIGNATGHLQVIPRFALNGVTTPTGSYAVIDLTQPGDLVDKAIDELIVLIRNALLKLFGIGADKKAPGYTLAALLGIVPPDAAGVAWPAEIPPPLGSPEQIRLSLQDPVGQIIGYYGKLLSSAVLIDGKVPFYYMVDQAGSLLTQVGGPPDVTVTGTGTPLDPWRVALNTSTTLPASLQVWFEDLPAASTTTMAKALADTPSTRKRLVLGFGFTPKLTISSTFEVDLDFTLDALGLDLDTTGATLPAAVQIFPGAGVVLDLPKGVSTPPVAGASVQVSRSNVSVYWSPYSGWSWSMVAGAPSLVMNGQTYPVGETMNFSDAASLQKLVTQGAETFGRILTGIAGMAIYQSTNRVGLAVDGLLGFLPNLGSLMPPGIVWPADMPVLNLTSFSDPLGALRGQINAIVLKPDRLKAALQLLAWAASSNASAPEIPGSGTLEDPFHVPLGLVSGVGLAVWSDDKAGTAGVGIDHAYTYSLPGNLQAVTRVVFRLVNGSLSTGKLVPVAGVPGATFDTVIRDTTGKLIPLTQSGFSLGSLSLGLGLSIDGTQLAATPYFLLFDLQLPQQPLIPQINVAEARTDDRLQQALFQALDAGLQRLFRDAIGDANYEKVYALLAKIGFAIPADTPDTLRGINPNGWLGLLSDPFGFASQRLMALVTDPASLKTVSELLSAATGVTLPTIPKPLLHTLNFLGLVQDEAHGWVPAPPNFVQLFSHPVRYLSDHFKLLIEDPVALTALVSELLQISQPVAFGPFELEVLSGPVVRVSLPGGKANVGSLLNVSGAVSLNLATRPTLGVALRLFNPLASLALVPALTVDFTGGTTSFTLQMAWGDGTQPAPPPLNFWPFNSTEFVNALSTIGPFYALSVIVSQVIDPLVLQPYPVAQVVFNALGVASQDGGGVWHTKSLLGLFDHPLEWLLGGAVLGANGQLNIAKIQQVLATMPATTFPSLGLGTKPIADGFQLYGLPYQMAVDFTANTTSNKFTIRPSLSAPLPIAGDLATIKKMTFGLSLGPNFQTGLDGGVTVAATIPNAAAPLALDTGFDKAFYLRVTDGTEGGMVLQLVPFPGWQDLLKGISSIIAQQLVPQLTQKLLQAMRENGAKEFADALASAGTKLDVAALLNALVNASPDAEKLEKAALGWLGGRFSTANVNTTAQAVVDLLKVAGLTLTVDGGLIRYKPSDTLPVTLMIGATKLGTADQVGAWVGLNLPKLAILQAAIDLTGIGMPFDPATGTFTSGIPLFNFGLALFTPIEGEERAPRLTLQFDNASKAFTSGIDPMGKEGTKSDLYRELLPQFFGNPPDLGKAIQDWLILILTQAAPRYVSIVLLNQSTIKGWLDGPLLGTTPGKVLDAAGLLRKEGETYVLRSFDEILALTVPQFVANLLKALLQVQFTVVTFDKDRGSIVVGPNASGAFGIRATVRDIALAFAPNFIFQIGASDKEWLRDDKLNPGVGIYVPITETAPEFTSTQLELVNIGVDFVGKQQKPLVDLSRFSLGAVKPRGLVLFDFATGFAPTKWGGAITLGDIALSFAPNTAVQGGKTNPVAQNLLGSGTPAADPSKTPNNPPTNPGFSASASFLQGDTEPTITFLGDEPGQDSKTEIWVPVQRTYGPLNVNQLGLSWQQTNTHLGALFDGSVTLAGLFVGMKKLSVSFNVKIPTDYTQYELDVQGLDIQFKGGPVTISGGFFKQDAPLRYDGTALLRAAAFGLDALGSFGVIPVDPNDPVCKADPNSPDCRKAISLFVFVNLNAPLGGPPAFFVEGLAAGFGYNRNLVIPAPGDIGEFPLVAGSINPDFFPKGADGKADPTKALVKLGTTVPPAIGVYWVGAGVKFSTFQFLSTFALLFLKFGREFEIDLVGVMAASLPPKTPKTIAYVELAVIASFKPAEGLVSVRGQLTPNSYILAPPVKLTGGFAIMYWYTGDHAGNFVITLGGYHPSFQKPDYYPDVPRVGILWKVEVSAGRLVIDGGAYFALTPSAFMAGGYLRAAFELGPIRAWLDAGANFLVQWNPFYYEVEIHISVGVAFKTEIAGVSITISASLGALLELWGPPTAGRARIDWYIISFTIPIGEQNKELTTQPLATWADFSQAFFPQPVAKKTNALGAPTPGDPTEQTVLKTTAELGLVSEEGPHGWLINPSAWRMTVATLVPASKMTATKSSTALPTGPGMGVRPMAVSTVTTPLTVTMQGYNPTTKQWEDIDLDAKKIAVAAVRTGAPSALWSKDPMNPVSPPDPNAALLANTNAGLTLDGVQVRCKDKIGPIPLLTAFGYVQIGDRFYPKPPVWPAPAALSQDLRFHRLKATIMATEVVATRNLVLQALRDHGVPALADPQLSVIAFYADSIYTAAPALAQLGTLLGSSDSLPVAAKKAAPAKAPEPETPSTVTLLGSVRRYASARMARRGEAQAEGGAALRLDAPRVRGRWVEAGATPAQNASQSLSEGTTAVYAVSTPEGRRATARVAGDLPVRLLAFNAHDELLADVLRSGGDTTLPAGTAKVAMQGAREAGREHAIGWQLDTMLVRVARTAFAGDGFLVRPQATALRRTRGAYVERGTVEAARVLADNRVRERGRVRPGWIETLLPESVGTVVVSLAAGDPGAVRVKIERTTDAEAWTQRYEDEVQPDHVVPADGGFLLFFNVPPADGMAAVLVETDDGDAVHGVWGLTGNEADAPPRAWSFATAHAVGAPVGGAAPRGATVTIHPGGARAEEASHA